MVLNIQEAPQAPSYTAAPIQVSANIATPQATMNNVKEQQGQLNAVNTLSGGGRSRRGRSHKSLIRTYKGRRYVPQHQTGGSSTSAQEGGEIIIPQVGASCSSGPQCAGAQNANFTAIHNQAQSNSINDAYATQKGGRKKVRFSRTPTTTHRRRVTRDARKPRHDQSLTSVIAYNIKKVLRKVFS